MLHCWHSCVLQSRLQKLKCLGQGTQKLKSEPQSSVPRYCVWPKEAAPTPRTSVVIPITPGMWLQAGGGGSHSSVLSKDRTLLNMHHRWISSVHNSSVSDTFGDSKRPGYKQYQTNHQEWPLFIILNKYRSSDCYEVVRQSSLRHLLFMSNFGESELETPEKHWTRWISCESKHHKDGTEHGLVSGRSAGQVLGISEGLVLTVSLVSKAILYLGAGQLEVRIVAVPDRGASFTVYQPGFVITARELKWSLWNGNPKGRTGTIENGTEREQIGNIKKINRKH